MFAVAWRLGALSPFGRRYRLDLLSIGGELSTTSAYRELVVGRPDLTQGDNAAICP